MVAYFQMTRCRFPAAVKFQLTPPLECLVFDFLLLEHNTFFPCRRQDKIWASRSLVFDGRPGGPKPNATLQLAATVNIELKWQVPVGVAPLANAPPVPYSLCLPPALLIWSQLHHLRARVHYNKSVVSCQSCGRCRMEPMWDLSNAIKGPLCKIALGLWFLHWESLTYWP